MDVTVGTVVNINVHSMVLFYLNTAAKNKFKLMNVLNAQYCFLGILYVRNESWYNG